jgi:hypothetical protein
MRVIEQLGIQQARNWGACTINEFRIFLGLKPYSTFEEWNPDPVIADAARKLYRSPDNIELYVGLVSEESKPVQDGAGLCPSCAYLPPPPLAFSFSVGFRDSDVVVSTGLML